jgi:hypothetical protein
MEGLLCTVLLILMVCVLLIRVILWEGMSKIIELPIELSSILEVLVFREDVHYYIITW